MSATEPYRTIWISDLHLGTRGANAELLLDFLRSTSSEHLYLVGDIIDGWRLRRSPYWSAAQGDVVAKLVGIARGDTRVTYVPGNHDEALRQYTDTVLANVEVVEETIHETADGKRLWVLHGDEFDGVMQAHRWLAVLGDRAYRAALVANRVYNRYRRLLGRPYWSLSQYLKHKVKNAVDFICRFEESLIAEAKARGFDGVVCGHIHKPELREVDGLVYANDGDWVESCSALVEHFDGRLEILDWASLQAERLASGAPSAPAAILGEQPRLERRNGRIARPTTASDRTSQTP